MSEENKYFKRYRDILTEWVELDDHIRASAKVVFPEAFVEGDSYGVPPQSYLFDALVSRILHLECREKPEGFADVDGTFQDVRRLFDTPIMPHLNNPME